MSDSTNKGGAKRRKLKDAKAVEVHPDAWDRFTKAVKRIVPGKPEGAKGKADAGEKPAPARRLSEQSE